MPQKLTITGIVIAALALPAGMAGATLYASNAAVITPNGELVPHFGKAPTPPSTRTSRTQRHHHPATTRRSNRTSGQRSGSHTWQGGSTSHRSGGSHDWSSGSNGWNSGGGSGSSHHWSGGRSGGGWDS